jgi:hypothetical protein
MNRHTLFPSLGGILLIWHALPAQSAQAPYPQSPVVTRLTWAPDIIRVGGADTHIGDNWPATWGDDDMLYTSWGDGDGFSHQKPELSLGFARVSGAPPDELKAEVLPSRNDVVKGGGTSGIKSSALLMVNRKIYMFVRNYKVNGDYKHARLAWSTDRQKTWTWADWHFAGTFGCPEFLQFGRDYEGARDMYIYIVSQDNDNAYKYAEDVVMARVPKDRIAVREAYEFFAGRDGNGAPRWSRDIDARRPVFTDPNGAQRVALSYNAALKRYFLVSSIGTHGRATQAMHTGGLGIFDAPEPWGPWTTVYYDQYWSGGGNLEYRLEEWTYHQKFPTKYMSSDGTEMWLLFSGRGSNYTFCLRKATLEVAPSSNPRP